MTKQKHFYLIRGLIREQGHWGNFVDHLKSTFPDALITMIEIPGAGIYFEDSSPPSVRGIVKRMRQDYLKAKMADEDSHLIAISLGGMISVEWMRTFPHDFHRATLINTSLGGVSPIFERIIPSALVYLLKVPFLRGRQKESHILKLVSNHEDAFVKTLDLWEQIQEKHPVSLDNTLRQLFAGALFTGKNFTPPIPVSILASTKDRMVNVKCSRAIAQKWNVPITEHPTGGHDLSVDDPSWIAQEIKKSIAVP
jgi:alpha-beta hydrolase superfamily lysophospholipase